MDIITKAKLVTTSITSDFNDFDLSYSKEIKNFLAEQMDIDITLLNDLECAFFTNYVKVSNNFSMYSPFQLNPAGAFRPLDNLLLISVDDFDLDKRLFTIIHETGHFLSLNYLSVSIAEACAMNYERKYAEKNNKIQEFNLNYQAKSLESYYYSLKLFDMISESVFENKEEIEKYTKRGSDEEFLNKIDNYLNSTGCNITASELFFLVDVLFFNRLDQEMVTAFKERPPYFYQFFDELHKIILPSIFAKKITPEQMRDINKRLTKIKKITALSIQMLNDVKISTSYENFSIFKNLFQQNLSKQLKKIDTIEYFEGKIPLEDFDTTIKDSIIKAFTETSFIFSSNQQLISKK